MLRKILHLIQNNRDYFAAILTGYGYFGTQVVVQILLVPLYLSALGKQGFGVLMLLLATVALCFQGIGWAYGMVLRVLGGAAAQGDDSAFVTGYAAVKWLYVMYALVALALAAGVFVVLGPGVLGLRENVGAAEVWGASPFAALYFLLLTEFSADQNALNALRRQAVANTLNIISMLIFAALVIPWLVAGAEIKDVFVCLIAGTLTSRALVWVYWRRQRSSVRWKLPNSDVRAIIGQLTDMVRSGYLAYGLIFIGLQADVLVMGLLGGPTIAAEYVLVWKIPEVLILLLWRLSESLQPELVHAEARGDHERLARIYRRGAVLFRLAALLLGCFYAVAGQFLVNLWLGSAAAPQNTLAFILAGGAIVWLGSARLPALFAYALGGVGALAKVAGLELLMKFVLIGLLYQKVGFLAPLVAINTIHLFGLAYAYARLSKPFINAR